MVSVLFIMVVLFFLVFISAIIFIISLFSWNIPVTVLRFTGDKRRPMIIHRKGRKKMLRGIPHLWVRGYSQPVRDYKAEFYYPSPKSKWGGLILWEFEDGWLTPVVPIKLKLDEEMGEKVDLAVELLKQIQVVDFEYDAAQHQKLKMKIVDDVDADFYIDSLERIDSQYSGGFLDWLGKNSTGILSVFIVIMVFVGFVVWLDKIPAFAAQCAAIARETITQSLLEEGASVLIPPG